MRFWRGAASRVYKVSAEAPPELARLEAGLLRQSVACGMLEQWQQWFMLQQDPGPGPSDHSPEDVYEDGCKWWKRQFFGEVQAKLK